MTPIAYFSASLHLTLALLLLWVLLFYFWRRYRIDSLRERLFELRGELFDYAAAGEVSFNDPAYTRLRMLMNGMIRFAHRFTTTRVAMIFIFRNELKNITAKPLVEWEKAVALLPAEKQKRLKTLHDRMMFRIAWHITTGSLVLLSIFSWYLLRYLLQSGDMFRFRTHERTKQQIEEVSRQLPAVEIVEAQAINAEIEEESSELVPA